MTLLVQWWALKHSVTFIQVLARVLRLSVAFLVQGRFLKQSVIVQLIKQFMVLRVLWWVFKQFVTQVLLRLIEHIVVLMVLGCFLKQLVILPRVRVRPIKRVIVVLAVGRIFKQLVIFLQAPVRPIKIVRMTCP